jgi:hypothetical protein
MPKDKKDKKLDIEDASEIVNEEVLKEQDDLGTPSYEELVDANEDLEKVSFES